MNRFRSLRFLFVIAPLIVIERPAIAAGCSVPNIITNGQLADASKVMQNFNAVAGCADASVKAAGISTSGSIAVISGPNEISGSDLSGDVSTSSGTTTTLAATGVVPGTYTNANIIVDAKGRLTAASNGSAGGAGGASGTPDITMALGAAWIKEMLVNGGAITAGTARSVKVDQGPYVAMRMMANTNSGFDGRSISTVSYTVPSGAVAYVVEGKFLNAEITDSNYYGARLYNITRSRVAAGMAFDPSRATPSQSPGTALWGLSYSGLLTTGSGGGPGDVNAYYPVAGIAGDVLRLEAWTNGDGNYRIQDLAVYLVVVDTISGSPISISQ